MPPLPVIADTYRVAFIWTGVGGTNPVNVMHFRDTTSVATAADLAAAINASASTDMFDMMVDDQSCGLFKVTPLDGVSGTVDFTTTVANFTGQQTGDYAPQVAAVVKLVTGLRGRSKRGRVFLGPVADAICHDGFWAVGTALSECQTAWEAFESGLVAAGFEIVVASYKLGSAQTVTAVSVEDALATQRRRQSRLR